MLYTRCPECETTFRITEGALQQAQGQVRCGRCSHIFDARESLTDRLPDAEDAEGGSGADGTAGKAAGGAVAATASSTQAAASAPSTSVAGSTTEGGNEPSSDDDAHDTSTETEAVADARTAAAAADAADSAGGVSAADADYSAPDERPSAPVAAPRSAHAARPARPAGHVNNPDIDADGSAAREVAAELETALADAEADGEDQDAHRSRNSDEDEAADQTRSVMSADEIDAVLGEASLSAAAHWLDDESSDVPERRSRLWLAAAIVATLVLGVQIVHHFRSALAGNAVVGAAVQSVYSVFGERVVPNWDVASYELIDWIALEDPAQQSRRNLIIRSQLRNGSDRAQPYPLIHLQLLNRFEEAVGARLFEPREYASQDAIGAMMQSGETIAAELVIVDPGADAYGFELAVCLETATGVACDTDSTFR